MNSHSAAKALMHTVKTLYQVYINGKSVTESLWVVFLQWAAESLPSL